MKKMAVVCAVALVCGGVLASPSAMPGMSTSNVVFAAQQAKFSDEDYVVAAFLKFSKKTVDEVQDGSIQVAKTDNHYLINDNQFTVTVNKKKVTIKPADQNSGNKKRVYSKVQLRKAFKGSESALQAKIAVAQDNQNESEPSAQQQASTSQQAPTQQAANGDDQNTGQKPMISENEWYERLLAAGWDENAKTANYYTQKAGLAGVDVAPQ